MDPLLPSCTKGCGRTPRNKLLNNLDVLDASLPKERAKLPFGEGHKGLLGGGQWGDLVAVVGEFVKVEKVLSR